MTEHFDSSQTGEGGKNAVEVGPPNPVELAAQAVGGQNRLAQIVKASPQAVSKWKRTRIPAERVLTISKATGVPAHLLRPDIYPPPPLVGRAA